MIRLLFILLFFSSFIMLNAKSDINYKIHKTSIKLNRFSTNYLKINKKMAETAKAILRQKKALIAQNMYLKKLVNELKDKEKSYKLNTLELNKLKKRQEALKEKQDKIADDLVFVIARSVSLSVILDDEHAVNSNSLIEFEVLKAMLKESRLKAKNLNKLYYDNSKIIDNLNKQTTFLEVAISTIDTKRKKVLETKKRKKVALKVLKLSKEEYKSRVQKILKQQDILKKTLARLNIIKIDAIKKAREDKLRKEAFARKQINLNAKLPKVKKHGSSYHAVKTKRYRGPKTIAPLKSYTIVKKYGTYIDPIYGIKIFNDSISLKAKHKNEKVQTVFNGKVIYADKTAVLKNIVIVEHKNGLHTIYANLSQISPNIRKGKKIKKGYTIGRVKNELVFEVTQKSYHINPIRLFR